VTVTTSIDDALGHWLLATGNSGVHQRKVRHFFGYSALVCGAWARDVEVQSSGGCATLRVTSHAEGWPTRRVISLGCVHESGGMAQKSVRRTLCRVVAS
jgi:hypothetical protein